MEITSDTLWANARDQAALRGFFEEYRVRGEEIAALLSLIQKQPALQHGTYHWRTISGNGTDFQLPGLADEQDTCILAWSRIFEASEILCVINLHHWKEAVVYVTIDDGLHASGTRMNRLLGSESIPAELNVEDRNGKSIRLTIPPRSLVMYG
ncbi:alpha amylase C-terminal domain-containing protein [Dyadobacter sp.]|uniref:alpha amylase C-terminal domain-containing protein n=1 Tax=Dyadobacter sp. TaxID=1914288 RepID=UPI003F6EDE24